MRMDRQRALAKSSEANLSTLLSGNKRQRRPEADDSAPPPPAALPSGLPTAAWLREDRGWLPLVEIDYVRLCIDLCPLSLSFSLLCTSSTSKPSVAMSADADPQFAVVRNGSRPPTILLCSWPAG